MVRDIIRRVGTTSGAPPPQLKFANLVIYCIVVLYVVSGAYTGFVEHRTSVTAWMQERPYAQVNAYIRKQLRRLHSNTYDHD